MEMTPTQQAIEDADRVIPTRETMRLLAWWYEHNQIPTVCDECGVELVRKRYGPPPKFCTPRCCLRQHRRLKRAA